jgi:hypothetical protein
MAHALAGIAVLARQWLVADSMAVVDTAAVVADSTAVAVVAAAIGKC